MLFSRLGKAVPSPSVKGNTLEVLRLTLDELAKAFEQSYSSDHAFTDADRANLRRLPTENIDALNSYLKGRTILETSDDTAADDRAIASFQDAVARDSNFAFAQAGLSQAYASYDKHADKKVPYRAITVARLARNLDANCDQAHVAMALAQYYSEGNLSNAVDEAGRAVALNPDSDYAHRVLGTMQLASGAYDAGLAELSTAVSLNGKNLMNQYALGRGWLFAGKPEEAVGPLRRVTAGLPQFESAYVNLSNAELTLGQWDFAIGDAKSAVDLNGRDAAAFNNLGTAYFFRAARTNDQAGYEQARKAYAQAAEFDPNNAKVRMNLGDAYDVLQKKSDAKREYAKAVALVDARLPADYEPGREAIAAKCQAKLGDFTTAEARALQAVSKTHALDHDVLYKLAVVYALWKNETSALDTLDKAVKAGYAPVLFRDDPDLKFLSNNPRFQKLVGPH